MANKDQAKEIDAAEEIENVEEQTTSATTLKPGASKTELLSTLISATAGMTKQDLSSFLTKTLDQIGKEADSIPAGAAERNRASVAAKSAGVPSPSSKAMKEDVEELFGTEELSEDFKNKAATIFEAAVNNRVAVEVARIEEEFESTIEEEITAAVGEMHTKVDEYMDYVVEQWMQENQVAIENNFRNEHIDTFISGLKNLFVEHYIDVPEEKVDLIGELALAVEALEASVNELTTDNIRLNKMIDETVIEAAFSEVAEDLADTQIEKLRTLSEGIEYSSAEEYSSKLSIIKEQYFNKSSEKITSTNIINEDVATMHEDEEEEKVFPPDMKNYAAAISRTFKR
jgi:hypothetical protein